MNEKAEKAAQDFKGLRYCQECETILKPSEEEDGKLYYRCPAKDCDGGEPAEEGNMYDNCIFRIDLEKKAQEKIINKDIVDDPSLQKRTVDQC